jgi:D-alanyl-D-alanine dipeptidase
MTAMSPLAKTLAELTRDPDYVNLREIRGVRFELKYASVDNFMGKDVYGQFTEPFLHRLAADKLRLAQSLLERERPGFSLLVYDALRPGGVQRVLWEHVKGTPNELYVADPARGSLHSYGCAVDLGVADDRGRPLDMGTGFDAFEPLSQPKLENEHLRSGLLSRAQVDNRLVLRRAMEGGGFVQLPHEWWHYDAFPGAEVRKRFRLIE